MTTRLEELRHTVFANEVQRTDDNQVVDVVVEHDLTAHRDAGGVEHLESRGDGDAMRRQVGATEIGQGLDTIVAQMAAETIGNW